MDFGTAIVEGVKFSVRASEKILEKLHDPDEDVQKMALWFIRRAIMECEEMPFSDACQKIGKKAMDSQEDEDVCDEALFTLALYKFWKGTGKDFEDHIEGLEDLSEEIRKAAIKGFSKLKLWNPEDSSTDDS